MARHSLPSETSSISQDVRIDTRRGPPVVRSRFAVVKLTITGRRDNRQCSKFDPLSPTGSVTINGTDVQ